jgi:hypothetical protein
LTATPTLHCFAGTIAGTPTAADISVLPDSSSDSVIPQGIQPGDFNAPIDAIRSGNACVKVHTQTFPAGEIRGQVLAMTPVRLESW